MNGSSDDVQKEFLSPWRDRIQNAADLGDVGALRKIADEIEHNESVECSSKLAEFIRRQAKSFNFEGLANLCECPEPQSSNGSNTQHADLKSSLHGNAQTNDSKL